MKKADKPMTFESIAEKLNNESDDKIETTSSVSYVFYKALEKICLILLEHKGYSQEFIDKNYKRISKSKDFQEYIRDVLRNESV